METKNLFSLLLTAAVCFCPVRGIGQIHYANIRFDQIGQRDGLPHNTVYDITQDNHGFIWYSTPDGLCKYDGYDITRFTHNALDSTTICHNSTEVVFNDSINDKLWVSTSYGISCYDNKNEAFNTYKIDDHITNSAKFAITSKGELVTCTNFGIYRFDEESDRFVKVSEWGGYNYPFIDKYDRLWVLSKSSLHLIDPVTGKNLSLPNQLAPFKGVMGFVRLLNNDRLVFSSKNVLYCYEVSSERLHKLSETLSTKVIRCAETDSEGNFWIGTEYGIFVLGEDGEQKAHYEQKDTDLSMLNDSPVYSIFRDSENNMWVGTYFGGVNYYISGTDQFALYPYGDGANHLSGKAVRGIINDGQNGLLIATEDGGLNRLDSDNQITRSSVLNPKYGIDTKNVHYIYRDKDGCLWFGLFEKGVRKYNPRTGASISYKNDGPERSSGFCITEDNRDRIWYASPTGIYVIDKKSPDHIATKVSSRQTFFLLSSSDSTFWVASKFSGVLEININTFKVTPLEILPDNHVRVTYFFRDSKDHIWIGTNNDGLFEVKPNKELIASYSEAQLGSSGIKGIIEDDNGEIWVGTTNGLCRLKSDGGIVRYTYSEGLPINQFNFASACKGPDGRLYFGTIEGMVSFYPRDIRYSYSDFDISLTGIWSNNDKMSPNNKEASLPMTVSEIKKLTLTHKQAKSLRIEYSGLNYQYGSNTLYAMKMDGIDKDWQVVGNQHQVRFSNLSSGNYVLRIKGSFDGMNWDDKGQLNLPLRVLPPWWLTWWAIAFYIAIAIASFIAIYKYAKTRLYLRMELKEEKVRRQNVEKLNKQETDFFTYVSHDLKTPLTLIVSPLQRLVQQSEITNQDRDKLKVIYLNANRMNYLIDELLSFSKIEMNRTLINVRKGDIMLFMKEISSIFYMVADEKEIDYILELDGDERQVWFSPSKLERIMYNLLSNAFKFTPAGGFVKLSAHYREENGQVFADFSVRDSGRGIPKDALPKLFDKYYQADKRDHREGFGLGLALTKSLVNIHKGKITVDSELGKGTVFNVSLNVSEDAYLPEQRSFEGISGSEIEKYNQRMKDTLELIPSDLNVKSGSAHRDVLLVVEDNKELNDYVAEIFRSEFKVIQTYDGAEASKVLETTLPDIIISDVMMPNMDGYELTSKVKQNISTSHIPVILLTAKVDENDQTQGYRSGADAYITKPFNADNLELLVNNIRSSRKKIIEHFKRSDELDNVKLSDNPKDDAFMKNIFDLIMANISNEDFDVESIIDNIGISRSSLHSKLKSLTGCSVTQLVRTIKMKEAKKHLLSGMNVSETSFAIGIPDPNYFTKCFRKEFGQTPSEFLKKAKS